MIAKPYTVIYTEQQRALVRDLYTSGISLRQVASQVGMSKSYVYHLCKDITRTRTEAVKLSGSKIITTHWRTMRQRARHIMEQTIGRKLERWEHVHHKDRDYTNNDISNIEVITASDHARLHHCGPEYMIPRHLRPKRKAYMTEYLKSYRKAHAA